MSDFSDRPLVAGTIVGLRAFQVDSLGRLKGMTHAEVFRPGENRASCKATRNHLSGLPDNVTVTLEADHYYYTFGNYVAPPPPTVVLQHPDGTSVTFSSPAAVAEVYPPKKDTHKVGSKDCACGFYAYFDGKNDYHSDSTIAAIVEGYGVCSVGDRGFRAEKARLLALVDPFGKPVPAKVRQKRLVMVARVVGVINLLILVANLLRHHWLVAGVNALAFGVLAGSEAIQAHSRRRARVRARMTLPRQPEVSVETWKRVRANYPDVPVFASVAEATAAHPLTPPEPEPLPTPGSHAEFWDMDVPK